MSPAEPERAGVGAGGKALRLYLHKSIYVSLSRNSGQTFAAASTIRRAMFTAAAASSEETSCTPP